MPLTDGQRAAVERHLTLAETRARHYASRASGRAAAEMRDELRGVAYYALCRAAQTYSPAAGTAFRTWAITKIHYEVQDYLRKVAADRLYAFPDGDEYLLVGPTDEGPENVDYEDLVRGLSAAVERRHRGWFLRKHLTPAMDGELAAAAGVCKNRMSEILAAAHRDVRHRFRVE